MLYLLDRYLIMSTVQCQIAKKFLMFAVGGNGYETTHCLQIDNASLEVYISEILRYSESLLTAIPIHRHGRHLL